jgi:hypothetical protein
VRCKFLQLVGKYFQHPSSQAARAAVTPPARAEVD